jgi:hypothetical protein
MQLMLLELVNVCTSEQRFTYGSRLRFVLLLVGIPHGSWKREGNKLITM